MNHANQMVIFRLGVLHESTKIVLDWEKQPECTVGPIGEISLNVCLASRIAVRWAWAFNELLKNCPEQTAKDIDVCLEITHGICLCIFVDFRMGLQSNIVIVHTYTYTYIYIYNIIYISIHA